MRVSVNTGEFEFTEHRERLFRVAYRMLGSVSDAEDVLQEAWLRWSRVDRTEIRDPLSLLVRTTARLALDRMRRIKARREAYIGVWLPEPLPTAPEEAAIASEAVSMAMLRVLETLSPLERAVFVLREAFDLPYDEIGEILDRKPPAVRQLARRARQHVDQRRSRFETDRPTHQKVTEQFLAATRTGDLPALMAVLAPGVTLIADGGGKVRAPLLPVVGADKVARFLLAVAAREQSSASVVTASLNGGLAVIVTSATGPGAVLELDVVEDRVQTIYLIGNPDKLAPMSRILEGSASSA